MPIASEKFRTNVEMPRQLYIDLRAALYRRAVASQKPGVLAKVSFNAWVREKAKETIRNAR